MRFSAVLALLAAAIPASGERRTTVASAATPSQTPLDTFKIAPGSLIRVSWFTGPGDYSGLFDPAAPRRVTIRPAGAPPVAAAVVESSDPVSVLARVPPDLPLGSASITLDDLAPVTGEVVRHAFGVFTILNGIGPARSENGLAHPAGPGSIVTLWGTGLNGGAVTGTIGGRAIEVLYAGPAPSLPGVDQLNLRLPDAVPEGCYTAVSLTAGGIAANAVTLTTGPGPCRHPLRLTPEELARIDAGDSVPVVAVDVNSLIAGPPLPAPAAGPPAGDLVTRMESATLTTTGVNAELAWLLYQPTRMAPGTCHSETIPYPTAVLLGGATSPVSFGPAVRLRGPDKTLILQPWNPEYPPGYALHLEWPDPVASPDKLPPTAWTPGRWSVEWDGSPDAQPFALEVAFAPPVELLGLKQGEIVDRGRDLTLRWKADGMPAGRLVNIGLLGLRTSVSCTAAANAGSITVPREVLARLEPVPADASYPATLSASLGAPPDQPVLFAIPKRGGTLPGVFRQGSAIQLAITIR